MNLIFFCLKNFSIYSFKKSPITYLDDLGCLHIPQQPSEVDHFQQDWLSRVFTRCTYFGAHKVQFRKETVNSIVSHYALSDPYQLTASLVLFPLFLLVLVDLLRIHNNIDLIRLFLEKSFFYGLCYFDSYIRKFHPNPSSSLPCHSWW